MVRPPKPADRSANPRHKTIKPKSQKQIMDDLNDLMFRQPTYDHFSDFIAETNAEKNDRGAAILLATNVENALQHAILCMLRKREGQERALFGRTSSPLGLFAAKIEMAYAMDIFGDQMKNNLNLIRTIRNTFAHAKIPIKFDTQEIKEACAHLAIPKLLPPFTIRPPSSEAPDELEGRRRFQDVCNAVAHNLNMYANSGLILVKIQPNQPLPQLPGNPEIYAKRPALP